jgi:flagellar protein FliL
MSAAAAPPADAGAAPVAKKGKKKLIIMLVAALVVLGGGGGAAFVIMKKKAAAAAAAAAEEGGEAVAEHAAPAAHIDPAHPPTFVPLDPFVVNLADRETEKYAQIGITLQVDDAKFADQMKAYMPAIRNGILMVLAHKTSAELLQREGKETLAAEIQREAVRPMGIEIDTPGDEEAEAEAEAKTPSKKKKKKRKAEVHNPVEKVHFSNFIIQ